MIFVYSVNKIQRGIINTQRKHTSCSGLARRFPQLLLQLHYC